MLEIADALSSLTYAVEQAIDWVGVAVGDLIAWLGGMVGWLGNAHQPVGEILAVLWPPIVAAILIVALLRSARLLILLWRGRTPRVQISPFAWTASEDGASEATWVTSLFREQLAELRLDALDPLPERAPGAPLVEIVEGVGQGVGRGLDIGKALGRLFRAVWPDAAYEVWGSLRPRDRGGGRISVQLVDRRGGNKTLLNVALEETGWEDGAREAAMAVAGALYPRVRERDRGPWTMWEETVPRGLMTDYHAARKYEEADCLEQALDRYHAALDQDPLNPNLRLKIAMLQERLELDLDAWVTYEAIVDEADPRAWRGSNRRVYLLAHYRLAVLLGNGRVAQQWVKNDFPPEVERTRRDRERQRLRKELLNPLEKGLSSAQRGSNPLRSLVNASSASLLAKLREAGEESAEMNLELFKPPTPIGESDERRDVRRREIDAVLQVLCLRHLEELDAWLRVRPPARPAQWKDWRIHRPAVKRWMKRRKFSRSAVRASKLVVRVRILASLERRYLAQGPQTAEIKKIRKIRKAHRRLSKGWPFPSTGIRRLTDPLEPRRRWANGREDDWQLHYNAACAVASVLRPDSVLSQAEAEPGYGYGKALPPETKRPKVIERAIAELEEYAHRAGSQRVAAQADWLAIDDPDFGGLRAEPEFKLWARHHLPRGLPPEEPYRKSDVRRFTVRVVREGARAFAASWRERAEKPGASAAEITAWWRDERRAWEMLGTSCREHLSWGERFNGLKALQDWLAATGRPETIDFGHEPRGDTTTAGALEDDVFEALADLAGNREPVSVNGGSGSATETPKPAVLHWVQGRVTQVRTAYEDGEVRADRKGVLRANVERKEALRAFRIWTWLAEEVDAELRRESSGKETPDFRDRLDRIHKHLPTGPVQTSLKRQQLLAFLPLPARSRWNGRGRSRGRLPRRRGRRRSGGSR